MDDTLRSFIREAVGQQMTLPGVDPEVSSSGDELRDLEAEISDAQTMANQILAKRDEAWKRRDRQAWVTHQKEYGVQQQRIRIARSHIAALKDQRSPAQKQRDIVYGGDPMMRPWGLGT